MQAQAESIFAKTHILKAVKNGLNACFQESRNICQTDYRKMMNYGILILGIFFILDGRFIFAGNVRIRNITFNNTVNKEECMELLLSAQNRMNSKMDRRVNGVGSLSSSITYCVSFQ
ncbi:hypothetical protein AK88_00947 [Plasmodium fragile]|uniref:Uncharacterized protein n=1 Tax=Plasmodium fragile TaxID=5857 RepID=A0A0D9QR71_PLAFR|nr:uncharacterized protein AK88_00947 [Plasmodium fragile]KJP89287.1 hypothetical protein AK88_00947 [Plasmodium fragile]